MNRKKKMNKILTKKVKKANAKNFPNNKARYISKADRAAAESALELDSSSGSNNS